MAEPLRRHPRARGFTLVELLVAISILAIIAVLGWRGLDGIVRARIALTDNMEQARGMQLTFAQLQSDCDQIVRARDIANRSALAAEAGRITLVRTVFADNQPVLLKVVAYRIEKGVLSRRESATTRDLQQLDLYWRAQVSDIDAGSAVVLQNDVTDMTARIWMENGTGWQAPSAMPAASSVAVATTASAATTPPASAASASASANVPIPVISADLPAPIGLEIALQLRGKPAAITKVFLLGAV